MKHFKSIFIKNISVRSLIILLFTVEIVAFAMIISYFSYNGGLKAITKNVRQMSASVNGDIADTLQTYLTEPVLLEQIHKNSILNSQLDLSNEGQRERYFVETLKLFPKVANTYIAMPGGHEYGARREDDGNFTVWDSNAANKTLNYYKYDSVSGRRDYVKSLTSYDTRLRPPYRRGVELKQPGWTDVYPSATGEGMVVTAVYPVYSANNELLGVLGSSLLLDWMDDFLRSLTTTPNSVMFILDKNENLIASTDKILNKINFSEKAPKLIRAGESNNALLMASFAALQEGGLTAGMLSEAVDVGFAYNGEKFLLHAQPIKGKNELGWISLVLIPERDLAGCLQDFQRQLLLITVIACILALVSGILSARYIINPLQRVNQAARRMAQGDFSVKLHVNRNDEIGQLISSFNCMSTELEQYFNNLSTERLRNKLLTAGLEASSNLVVILDANRCIWWFNAAFEALSGFSLREAAGKNVRPLLSRSNTQSTLAQVKRCMLKHREWQGELIVHGKNDVDYIDEIIITPILDEGGKVSYFLVVGKDITEKVKAREAMLAAQEAKLKAEKIFSIGTMAAGISHEINQPLNSIKVISGGILYLLRNGEKLTAEEFIENIKEISTQSDRIANIIKHLRSFIGQEQNQLMPCSLNTAVAMAAGLVGTQISSHGIRLDRELQEALPAVMAVPTGLEEIIVNLLVNAMQALDEVQKPEKRILVRTYFAEKVILEVSDNGTGIDAALGDRIFESFTSTKARGENLGLGLTIVNNIVTFYNGSIEVTANDMGGATFTVALPACQVN